MNSVHPFPAAGELSAAIDLQCAVTVSGLRIEAAIGVHAHELNRRQPLIIDVEADVVPPGADGLDETLDYEQIVAAARRLADGHIALVETFAWRLAQACLRRSLVVGVRVSVRKPEALADGLAGARVHAVKRQLRHPCGEV